MSRTTTTTTTQTKDDNKLSSRTPKKQRIVYGDEELLAFYQREIKKSNETIENIMYMAKLKRPTLDVEAYMDTITKMGDSLQTFVKLKTLHSAGDVDGIYDIANPPKRQRTPKEQAIYDTMDVAFTNFTVVGEVRSQQILTCKPKESWISWRDTPGRTRPNVPGQDYINTRFICRSLFRFQEIFNYVSSKELKKFEENYEEEEEEDESTKSNFIGPKTDGGDGEQTKKTRRGRKPRNRKKGAPPLDSTEDYDLDLHVNRHYSIDFLLQKADEYEENLKSGKAKPHPNLRLEDVYIMLEELKASLKRFKSKENLTSKDYQAYTNLPKEYFEKEFGIPTGEPETEDEKQMLFYRNLFVGVRNGEGGNASKKKKKETTKEEEGDENKEEPGELKWTIKSFFGMSGILTAIIGVVALVLAEYFAEKPVGNELGNMMSADVLEPRINEHMVSPIVNTLNQTITDQSVVISKANEFLNMKNAQAATGNLPVSEFVQHARDIRNMDFANVTTGNIDYDNFCAAAQGLSDNPISPLYDKLATYKTFHYLSYVNTTSTIDNNGVYDSSVWTNITKLKTYWNKFEQNAHESYYLNPKNFCVNPSAPNYEALVTANRKYLRDRLEVIKAAFTAGEMAGKVADAANGIISFTPEQMKYLEKVFDAENELLQNLVILRDGVMKDAPQFIKKMSRELAERTVTFMKRRGVSMTSTMIHSALLHLYTPTGATEAQKEHYANVVKFMISGTIGDTLLKAQQANNFAKLLPTIMEGNKYDTIFHASYGTVMAGGAAYSWYHGVALGAWGFLPLAMQVGQVIVSAPNYFRWKKDPEEQRKMAVEKMAGATLMRNLLIKEKPNQEKMKDEKKLYDLAVDSLQYLVRFMELQARNDNFPNGMIDLPLRWDHYHKRLAGEHFNDEEDKSRWRTNRDDWQHFLHNRYEGFPKSFIKINNLKSVQLAKQNAEIERNRLLKGFKAYEASIKALEEEAIKEENEKKAARRKRSWFELSWDNAADWMHTAKLGLNTASYFSPFISTGMQWYVGGIGYDDLVHMTLKGIGYMTAAAVTMVTPMAYEYWKTKQLENGRDIDSDETEEEESEKETKPKKKKSDREEIMELVNTYNNVSYLGDWLTRKNLSTLYFRAAVLLPMGSSLMWGTWYLWSQFKPLHDLTSKDSLKNLVSTTQDLLTNRTAPPIDLVIPEEVTSFFGSASNYTRVLATEPLNQAFYMAMRSMPKSELIFGADIPRDIYVNVIFPTVRNTIANSKIVQWV